MCLLLFIHRRFCHRRFISESSIIPIKYRFIAEFPWRMTTYHNVTLKSDLHRYVGSTSSLIELSYIPIVLGIKKYRAY